MHMSSHSELITNFEDPKRDLQQKPDLVIHLIAPLKGLKVVDIGVGSGYFSFHLLKAEAFVTGADVDDNFLNHVAQRFPQKEYPNFTALKIDFDNPKMGTGNYDMAFTSNTYHHIQNRVEYLKKVKLGLKKNGRVVIFDFKKNSHKEAHFGPPQKMRVALEIVEDELKKAGFGKIVVNNNDFQDHYLVIATN